MSDVKNLDDNNVVGVCRGQLTQLGRDHLAGSTPGGKEVQHHQFVAGLGQLGGEIILQMKGKHFNISIESF